MGSHLLTAAQVDSSVHDRPDAGMTRPTWSGWSAQAAPACRLGSSPSRLVRCSGPAASRQLLDRDDLKRLYKAAGRQPSSLTVRGEPLTQVLLEPVPMDGWLLWARSAASFRSKVSVMST